MPTLLVPRITVDGELKIPVPVIPHQSDVKFNGEGEDRPITRLTTSAITDQIPKRNRSSGALVIIVLGMFSGKISRIAELILLSSS